MNKKQQDELHHKMHSSNLSSPDWFIPQTTDDEPLNGFPTVPTVRADDGGLWVPVFIYVNKEQT